ncbi:DUF3990 domain-containing protein [Heyndrickxia sporothermodurans]|uniref:DUF3990 domain-containing protein n=1 Tax=Heyndrickxia sporothermodurans TaxID=46224 RepID=UPI0035D59D19
MNNKIANRTFHQLSKYWYHGTTSEYFSSLSSNIDLSRCKEYTDFGKGFYLTSNFTQASKHAENRATFEGEPVVFVYELNIANLKEAYTGKFWVEMNSLWSDFIYLNRSQQEKFTHGYDFVYGGVADGKIHTLIKNRDKGIISSETFFQSICKYPNYDQLSIHNQEIIDYNIINNVGVVNAYEKGKQYNGIQNFGS